MIDFLTLLCSAQSAEIQQGETETLCWQWLDEGILQFYPKCASQTNLVLSAGIHGNETAPIELLAQLCQDLLHGRLTLQVNLLCILGNPLAIRAGVRYVEHDMNRMFCGEHQRLVSSVETQRAACLEQFVTKFFQASSSTIRYHFDLHTAIRESYFPTFALLPFQVQPYDSYLIQVIESAELDALVYHNATGQTFTHFTSSMLQSASVTLELGKAKAFGENDLSSFAAIDQVLRKVVAGEALTGRKKAALRQFKVVDSILKIAENFSLHLTEDAPNFTVFQQGEVIATQIDAHLHPVNYVAQLEQVFILFPNPKVKLGLRAGLVLEEIHNSIDKA